MTKNATISQEFVSFLASSEMAGHHVTHDEDLLMTGALDSLSVARLIAFIETRFEITVPIAEVLPENMGTIDALTSYIISKNTT